MATYNVNSAHEFCSAIAGAQSGDIIEINSDLDWNDEVESVTETIMLSGGDTITGLEINGNNHAFYNLTAGMLPTTGSGIHIFSFGNSTAIKINGLSFLNCNMGSKTTHIINCLGGCTISNSVIQGKFKSTPFYGNIQVRDSMITVSRGTGQSLSGGSGTTSPKLKYCWIRLDDCRWEYNSNVGSVYAYNLDTCYIEGKLSIVSAPANLAVFRNVNNSCINTTISLQDETLASFITASDGEGGPSPTILNTDKMTFLQGQTETNRFKLVTDAQMKDADYLADIGFDIVP